MIPFYGEISKGFTGFSEKELVGDTLVFDGDTFKVYDRNDANLAGHKRLSDNWMKSLLIT